MTRRLLATLMLSLCAGLPSCVSFSQEGQVLVSSDPAGARIFVDGRDTGFTTPKKLSIGSVLSGWHVIRLEKPGFRPADRALYQQTETFSSKWIDGAYEIVMAPLPFFWTARDMLIPVGVRSALLPGELYVRMQRSDEPLLGFDALRQRGSAAGSGQ
ncbi:MAG: PEGA domain-containing protein [Planctomycetota bacterium]|nr:PEGA domain-containing protein [Planctomycetota bacterium]